MTSIEGEHAMHQTARFASHAWAGLAMPLERILEDGSFVLSGSFGDRCSRHGTRWTKRLPHISFKLDHIKIIKGHVRSVLKRIRLPRAHMDGRFFRQPKVDHQKQIPFVFVG